MDKMFKNLLLISLFGFFIFLPLQPVDAMVDHLKAAAGEKGAGYEEKQQTPTAIAMGIVQVGLTFVGTVFLVLTIYAGIMWMTAGGNDEQLTKAKKTLVRSVIGLAIVTSAYSISLFAERLVRGDGNNGTCRKTASGGQCCVGESCWDDPATWISSY